MSTADAGELIVLAVGGAYPRVIARSWFTLVPESAQAIENNLAEREDSNTNRVNPVRKL